MQSYEFKFTRFDEQPTPNCTRPFLHCVYIMLRLLVLLGLFSVLQCDFFSALYKLQDLLREEEKLQLDLSRYISSVQENEQDVPLEILRYAQGGSNYYSFVKGLMIFMGTNLFVYWFLVFYFFTWIIFQYNKSAKKIR